MLIRMPGSVAVYKALPLVPEAVVEPEPEIFKLTHYAIQVSCLVFLPRQHPSIVPEGKPGHRSRYQRCEEQ